jgi:hypothetical protein
MINMGKRMRVCCHDTHINHMKLNTKFHPKILVNKLNINFSLTSIRLTLEPQNTKCIVFRLLNISVTIGD